jgi:hypothetical protein
MRAVPWHSHPHAMKRRGGGDGKQVGGGQGKRSGQRRTSKVEGKRWRQRRGGGRGRLRARRWRRVMPRLPNESSFSLLAQHPTPTRHEPLLVSACLSNSPQDSSSQRATGPHTRAHARTRGSRAPEQDQRERGREGERRPVSHSAASSAAETCRNAKCMHAQQQLRSARA